jgi:putative FmdB family regulatory protein
VPTYQYTCTDCGEPIEVVQKFTDDPLSVCAACGGRLRKIFSPVGIVFKGSGFYRTDSRNGSSASTAAKDNAKDKQSSESSSASSAASDKPADKKSSDKGDKAAASSVSSGSSSSSSSEKVA